MLGKLERRHRRIAAQLSAAQSITHIGSWDQQLKTDHVNWSDETYRIFGFEPDSKQLTGQRFIDGVHPEDREKVLDFWSKARQAGTGYTIDHRLIRPDGVVRYVREIAEIRLDQDGRPDAFIGTVQDITEATRTARALENSESHFRSITENVRDIISIHLSDGTIVYENPAADRVLGFGPQKMIRHNIREFVHADDINIIDRGLRIAARRQSARHRFPVPNVRVRRSDGTWRTLEIRARYLDEQDGRSRILVVSRDVTDQMAAFQELQRNNQMLELLGNVGIAANSSRTLEEVLQYCIDEVCRVSDWPIGHAYLRGGENGDRLLPTSIWNSSFSKSFEFFRRVTETTSFSNGIGLPGRVFSTGKPAWITDVMIDSNFPRAGSGNEIGVRGAFAFPVLSGSDVVAVLEFYDTHPSEPDHHLLETLAKVGAQAGRVSERRNADAALKESENRFRNFAESASDWFWEIDAELRYSDFSGRNDEVLGISSQKSVGRNRWEVLQEILTDEEKADVEKWTDHNALLARREPFQDFRYAVNHPDGEIIHLRLSGIPSFDEAGGFCGYRGTAREETIEVKARQEEAAARALLMDAVESLADGFALFDADDKLVLYNKPFEEVTNRGVPGSLVVGETFEQILVRWAGGGGYDLSKTELGAFVNSRMELHRNLPSDNIYHLADGNWVQVTERRTSDGGCVMVRHTITGLMQVEEALRSSEERMRQLIDIAPEAIIVTDQEMKIQIFNSGAERTFGYSPDEAVGERIELLMPLRFRHGHDGHVREFNQSGDIGRAISDRSEIIGMRKNGEEFSAEAAISRLSTPEGPVFTLMLRDVTARVTAENELKRAQAHLEDAIESISQSVSLWSADRKLILYNKRFSSFHEKNGLKVFVGQDLDEMIDEGVEKGGFASDIQSAREVAVQRKKTFDLANGVPFNRLTRDNRVYQVVDVRTHDGGVLSVGSDVTDIVNREEIMQEAMRHAELANRAKSEFLANMSHELRTPLNAILGFSEILKMESFGKLGDNRYSDYVSDIFDSGTHLLEIINDILDLSRIEAGQVTLREEPVDVREIVDRVIAMLRGRAAEGGVNIVDELLDDLPELYADARILRQILVNLVSNAVKFTEREKEVCVSAEINSSGEFVICISDEGIGIKEEDIARVLEPFGQVDGSETRTFEGVGLGLPLTKSFVEMHGGDLHLESEPGVGTTVSIAFPPERVVEVNAG